MAASVASVSLSLPSLPAVSSGRPTISRRACVAVRCQVKEQCSTSEEVGISRREVVSGAVTALSLFVSLAGRPALALLESDDDDSLLEKVKANKQKKIKKRVEFKSEFLKETESVQAAVYELSKVGQALDGSDFVAAGNVLSSSNKGWITNVEAALSKVSSSSEEQGEAENFSSAIAKLQSAVSNQDRDKSKKAFLLSAGALERWSALTGISEELQGL